MSRAEESCDVLIVGMGPVGAAAACLLGRSGLSVKIVDREAAIYDKPRAIVLDHEALRVLQFCGLDQAFFDAVTPHTGTDFVGTRGQLIKLFDPKAPPFELGWPPNVMFIQPELEAALATAMKRLPCISAEREFHVNAIAQDSHGVQVYGIDRNGGVRTIQASWVIGADGANSIVRETAQLLLQDLDFGEWWVVVDAWLVGEADLPAKTTQYCQPRRPATYVVGPKNLRRWEIKLLPGEDPDDFRDPEAVIRLLGEYVDVTALSIWRSAVYRFRAAVAEHWREGRLILAGDAAHTMPPFLAQGLCAGIRDAINLSWKLAHVIARGADPALLDSYEEERKPHVSEVVSHAKDFGLIIGELDEARAQARDKVLEDQLRSGAVPTERQAFIPPLRGGMIDERATAAGTLFVQPLIECDDGSHARMDDMVAPEFLIIADETVLLALDEGMRRRWLATAGMILAVGPTGTHDKTFPLLRDQVCVIQSWLTRHAAKAVIVRPDRYVYGAAQTVEELSHMAENILAHLAGATRFDQLAKGASVT